MDFADGKSIIFQDFDLNSVTTSPGTTIGAGMNGCLVDSIDLSDLDVVQFSEKRALAEGLDVGIVQLGGRRAVMAGTLYGSTRALFFDQLRKLRHTLNAKTAYDSSPGDKGYLPLYFSEPTNDIDNWPDGAIPMRLLVMPYKFQVSLARHAHGGDDAQGLAVPWECLFAMRDPRIYAECPIEIFFTPTANVSDTTNNPSLFPAPLNGEWVVTSHAGAIVVAMGDSQFTITLPTSSGDRIIRLKGDDKILTIEEEDTEVVNQAALTFQNDTSWPLVPAGVSAYSVSFTGGLVLNDSTSKLWYWPSWI